MFFIVIRIDNNFSDVITVWMKTELKLSLKKRIRQYEQRVKNFLIMFLILCI